MTDDSRRGNLRDELRRALALAEQLGDHDVAAHVRALLDGLG